MLTRREASGVLGRILLAAVVAAIALAALFSASDAGSAQQSQTASKRYGAGKVIPILFVPADRAYDSRYPTDIDAALGVVSDWYGGQIGSQFSFEPTMVVRGLLPLNGYCPRTTVAKQCIQVPGEVGADPGDIHNVLNELRQRGILGPPGSIRIGTVPLVFWVGGYGFADGGQSSPIGGFAAVGDWALDGLSGKYEAGSATSRCSDSANAGVICRRSAQLGTVAHELGHAFGLPHSTDDKRPVNDPQHFTRSLMLASWDFPDVVLLESLSNPEKQMARNNYFLAGTKLAIPQLSSDP